MQQITGKTKLLGVIGDPIAHSLSPLMQNAAIAALGVDYVYVPFAIKPADLKTAIAGFESINLVGFNVTIPHKQTIIPLLSEVCARAQMVGAVNTVWRTETGWSGTNTDIEGFLAPLKNLERDWQQIKPIILGNGGAARAVVVGCAELGCPEICVFGRDRTKLEAFQQSWTNTPLKAKITVCERSQLPGLLSSETKLLVNTTPIGMSPNTHSSPVETKILEKLPSDAIAYDLIYTPNPTLFLAQAKELKIMAIDGLEMLVCQGAAALEKWLARPVTVDIMRRSLQQYLKL
jgi:shikimate dehydrogenase